MKYRLMGKSGLRVAELCLGTMTFGEDWGWGTTKDESRKIFNAYSEAGGNFIDTANRYTDGTSEKYLGEFLIKNRDKFVLSTKYTLYTDKKDVNSCGNHRKNMVHSLNSSLKRLNTDYVDIYWVHAWDFTTRTDEVMRALDDLISSGKVLYVGISNTPAWVIARANTISELRGWSKFVGIQVEYNLTERSAERDLIPMANQMGIGILPWGILAAGVLTGKYNNGAEGKAGERLQGRSIDKAKLDIAATVVKIAKQVGCSPAHVAINWVRSKRGISSLVIGARTEEQLLNNISCLKFELSESHLRTLDKKSELVLGYPHDFLRNEVVREMIYGANYPMLSNL